MPISARSMCVPGRRGPGRLSTGSKRTFYGSPSRLTRSRCRDTV